MLWEDERMKLWPLSTGGFIVSFSMCLRRPDLQKKDDMIYYASTLQQFDLVLHLRERKPSSLQQMFLDAKEVEDNVRPCGNLVIWNRDKYLKQEQACDSKYELDLEHQQRCKYISDLGKSSSTFADYSKDRYAYQVYDQFPNHVEYAVTDDGLDNYIFLADHK